jgi:NAD(P)-dependent dehydrogenase (short-subunit alcohol dehydrogenase family)
MATPEGKTADGFEQQFGVNHLASFTLTVLLLPTLQSSSTPTFNSRVIMLTSNGHRYSPPLLDDVNFTKTPYNQWVAYGQSKTGNLWTANYIDRVYGPRGVHANAVMPGGIFTGLQQHLPGEAVAAWKADEAFMAAWSSPAQGAATTIWAATAPVWEGKGGKYLTKVGIGEPAKNNAQVEMDDFGYAPHAFDEEGEKKLWDLSCKLAEVTVDI